MEEQSIQLPQQTYPKTVPLYIIQLKQTQLTRPPCPFSWGTWCEAEGDTHVNAGLAENGYLFGTEIQANEWSHEPFPSLSSAHPMLTQLSIPQHRTTFFSIHFGLWFANETKSSNKIYVYEVWNTEQFWSIIWCRYTDNQSLSPKLLCSLNVSKIL